ncbi:glycosyl hydrolase family 18 protein [Spiroplasma endosymbiont of Anurida maritima]|uniref:glycosyl hydrolase family 18 protein n=1 Tax=Spiroplasma endosymbiont of Anurida maritima TaxID=2967972 RepID=UPI0036D2B393
MKKLLSILGSFIIIGGAAITVVACDPGSQDKEKPLPKPIDGEILVGYWYGWSGAGQKLTKIEEIDKAYDYVNLSFLFSPSSYTMPKFDPVNFQEYEVKQGIEFLHSRGQKALISLGGATGSSMRFRMSQKDELKRTILDVVDYYNLDGLDIDFEGEVLADNESLMTTAAALKEIHDEWLAEGKDFTISMAPEWPYLRKNTNNPNQKTYINLLETMEGYYDYVHPQFYNGYGDGITVQPEDVSYVGYSGYLANNNKQYRAEFLYLMYKYMIEPTGTMADNDFYHFEDDKLGLGVITADIGQDGAVTEENIIQLVKLLNGKSFTPKGLMTWSILFDHEQGWRFAYWYEKYWNNNLYTPKI